MPHTRAVCGCDHYNVPGGFIPGTRSVDFEWFLYDFNPFEAYVRGC